MKHRFTSPYSDSADATLVKPSNWNDSHVYGIRNVAGSFVVAQGDDWLLASGGNIGVSGTMCNPVAAVGQPISITRIDAGTGPITMVPFATELFNSSNELGATSYVIVDPGQTTEFRSDGTNWWVTETT